MASVPSFKEYDERDITSRSLDPHERSIFGSQISETLPLVIQAKGRNKVDVLKSYIGRHTTSLMKSLHEHGALLFRGFDLKSESEFEQVMASLHGFHPFSDYLLRETNRRLVPGTKAVFTINSKYSGLRPIAGVHTENFHTMDVPRLQSFWCKKAPWFGGETALIRMSGIYQALSADCQTRLERYPVLAHVSPVQSLAQHYRLSSDRIQAFFSRVGLPTVLWKDVRYLPILKPSVFIHPNGSKTLQVNLSSDVVDFDAYFEKVLLPFYGDIKWLLHRFLWRHPRLLFLLLYRRLPDPEDKQTTVPKSTCLSPDSDAQSTPQKLQRLRQRLSSADVETMGRAIEKNILMFSWRQNDILLFDNTLFAHAGMPGFGPRTLRVMLGNPIPFQCMPDSGVFHVSADDGTSPTLDSQLVGLANRNV